MSNLAILYHPDCERHDMGSMHPESPARTRAILRHLQASALNTRLRYDRVARPATGDEITRVHPQSHLDSLLRQSPAEGLIAIDPDTLMGPASLQAAFLAAGSVVQAVDAIETGEYSSAFCNIRPPGHHAETTLAMGFCFFNNVAIGVRHAQQAFGYQRMAVLDFDVHHGNGTVDIFKNDPDVLVCSSFQHPFFPLRYHEIDRPNIINCPLSKGEGSEAFRRAVQEQWLPALSQHRPEMIFVSAGFDAHVEDPLGGLCLADADFHWVGEIIGQQAVSLCEGRVISVLEGGYDLSALARSVEAYLSGQCREF